MIVANKNISLIHKSLIKQDINFQYSYNYINPLTNIFKQYIQTFTLWIVLLSLHQMQCKRIIQMQGNIEIKNNRVFILWMLFFQNKRLIIQQNIRSKFLLQMKANNIYSLVKPYEQLMHNCQDPCKFNQTTNIFKQETMDKLTEYDLNNSKSYQIVGWNELNDYRNRVLKRQKLSLRKDTLMRSDRMSSRDSIHRQKDHFIDKQQFINTLPLIKNNHSKKHAPKKRKQSWMTNFLNSDQSKNKYKNLKPKNFIHQFSIKQIKTKMKEHQNEWKKVFSNQNQNEKFPSISKSIELHRSNQQQKSILSLQESVNNIKSDLWNQILRKEMNMTDIYNKKQITKTITDNDRFITRGNSKFTLQKQWIDAKQQQGYRFKLHRTIVSTEEQKKLISIR